jgi:hypothetical protein
MLKQVRKREKEKNDIVKEKGKQDERIEELQNARDRMSKLLKEEQTKVSAHLKTLKYYESQQKAFDLKRQENREIKQSLVTLSLQSLEVLLDGLILLLLIIRSKEFWSILLCTSGCLSAHPSVSRFSCPVCIF